MNRLALIHFHPIELYPPIQNLIRFIESKNENIQIDIYTTNTKKKVPPFITNDKRIRIRRFGTSGLNFSTLKRYYNYFNFYFLTTLLIGSRKPNNVLYFDTISSFPAYLVKRFFRSKTRIFIHYHEYISPEELQKGMKLVRYFHSKEIELYFDAIWVSHTNEKRMEDFQKDLYPLLITNPEILPNYPPSSWLRSPIKNISSPLKMVTLGALSLDTMYVDLFSKWIIEQKGKVTWDIYSLNISKDVILYLKNLNSTLINISPGIAYEEVPKVLKNFQIGVILYKGVIPNHINVIPNKLFEYLICGLDVWFPKEMTGSYSEITSNTYPKVIKIDFNKLDEIHLNNLTDRQGYTLKQGDNFYEKIYTKIWDRIVIQ